MYLVEIKLITGQVLITAKIYKLFVRIIIQNLIIIKKILNTKFGGTNILWQV